MLLSESASSRLSQKKAILLTGATGFLGSHLARKLHANQYKLVILKRSGSDTSRIGDLLPLVTGYDIDHTPLAEVFAREEVDTVIHAATCYGRRGESCKQVRDSNVSLPTELLEMCVRFGASTFVNTDTTLPDGINDYVTSKKQFLAHAVAVARETAVHLINLRLAHIYGPGSDSSNFISFLVEAFLAGRPAVDLTSGEQRRDFVYVDDVVSAYLTVLHYRASMEGPVDDFEVGSGTALPLKEVVHLVRRLCNSTTELRFGTLPCRAGEPTDLRADNTALQRLGWTPSVPVVAGLSRLIKLREMTTA